MSWIFAAASVASYWPFVVLIASVIFIIVGISVIRWHPFIALILAALLAGIMASFFPESTVGPDGNIVITSLGDVIGLVTAGFGKTAGGVAISIGLAAIIGMALMESGGEGAAAADRKRLPLVCAVHLLWRGHHTLDDRASSGADRDGRGAQDRRGHFHLWWFGRGIHSAARGLCDCQVDEQSLDDSAARHAGGVAE